MFSPFARWSHFLAGVAGAVATLASHAAHAEPAPEESASTWHVVPAVLPAYQPETSFLLGGAAVLAIEPSKETGLRASQVVLAGAASVRRQFSLLLQPDLYLDQDRWHLGATLSLSRFPDLFYGVGGDTRLADEEAFTPIYYDVEVSPKWGFLPALYLGPSVRWFRADIVRTEAGGQLEANGVTGALGGDSVELGLSLLFDTRDSTLYPRRGQLIRARAVRADSAWGSDYDFDLLRLDARLYQALPWSGQLLAFQLLAELRSGSPPFYGTGRLGGAEILRGYYEGRYRDRQYLAIQTEYRFPLVWRLGGVAFAAAGGVAPSLTALRSPDMKASAGVGLRLAPLADVPVNIRLDAAYGSEANFYFGIGEAF